MKENDIKTQNEEYRKKLYNSLAEIHCGGNISQNTNKKKVDPRKKLFTEEQKKKAHLEAQKRYLEKKKQKNK